MITVYERLRQLRKDAEISQDCLAEWLGVTRSSISQLETGRWEDTTLGTLRQYCRVFRMTLSELLEGVD